MTATTNRRSFILRSGAVGLTVLFDIGVPGAVVAASNEEAKVFRPNAGLTIDADGKIVVHIDKAEMGQGVTTALAQIVAEELEADWNDVSFVLKPYTIDQGFVFTASSLSIYLAFDALSRASAAARRMLVATAAEHWGVDSGSCRAANSSVSCKAGVLSYADIVKMNPRVWPLTAEELAAIELKQPRDYEIIGKSNPSPRHRAKVRGELQYGIDFSLPEMVYAKVAYPPSRGSTHQSVDDSAARQVPGYLHTVVTPQVVAVVADTYTAAVAARDALRVTWNDGPNATVNSEEIWQRFTRKAETKDGRLWVDQGDTDSALGRAEQVVSQSYTTDIVAHLQMEPVNAVAELRDGEMHLYCGTQYPTRLVQQVAEQCQLPAERVHVHGQFMGGGFGSLIETEWHVHAAIIAKHTGRPVKLILSREEDTANDCFRSPTLQKLSCGLTPEKTVSGWEHRAVAAWPSTRHDAFLDQNGFDSYALSGSDHHYGIPDQRVLAIEENLGPPVGYVRGVACGYMFFAIESFMDEVAHVAQQDPLAWRLALLEDRPRLRHVLSRVADLGGWGNQQAVNTGLGLSAITAQDSHHNTTRIATCAQARVEAATGKIIVEKISCVVDCGIVINPNGAMAMAEGALLYGLSIALKGGGTLKDGRIVERNFDSYPVLRMSEVPEMEIEFVESSEPATGMGESAMGSIAPALANAVYAACGARVRALPMTPDRVRGAMNSV